MSETTYSLQSFSEAAAGFRDGSDTPRAFLERCIKSIEEFEPGIGAFVELNLAGARLAADAATERWKAGAELSLIDGMPVGIKDIMETADMVTEQGSPLFAGWRSGRDAAAVVALREAGAVIVGKTVTTEFASIQPRGTRNPWDLERTPGGSSSGSGAAVGAGMLPAALGTQVVGSILRPASFCGCFGFKPSVGGINRGGSFDEFSQSCSGVLAASLDECWSIARAISARIGGDPGYVGLLGPMKLPDAAMPLRIALLETGGWQSASEEGKQALGEAAGKLAAGGIEIADRRSDAAIAEAESAIADAQAVTRVINNWEGRWPLNTYSRDLDPTKLSQPSRDRLAQAESMTQEEYQTAILERERVRGVCAALAEGFDVCITLAASGAAPVGLKSSGDPIFLAAGSMLGVPALTLPVLRDQNLPLGLQIMGFRDADAAMFASAAAILPLVEGS